MQRCTKQEDVIWKAALRIRASTVAPKHMQAVKDGLRDQYHHAINIVPTILELLDITLPESIKGVQPPYQFEGGTIKKVTVNVSGEHVLDLEKEAWGMLVREWFEEAYLNTGTLQAVTTSPSNHP
jgi:arylsulfatase A-like enzyme